MGDLKFTKIIAYNQSKGGQFLDVAYTVKEGDNKIFNAMLEDKILYAKWSKVAKIGPI